MIRYFSKFFLEAGFVYLTKGPPGAPRDYELRLKC